MAVETDVELAAVRETQRRLSFEGFDGCPWADLEGAIWPYGDTAPDAADLKCAIDIERVGGGWYSIPTAEGAHLWSVDQCTEKVIRERFGGGRRYRVSIRWGKNTVRGSNRYVDLSGDLTSPRLIPGLPKEMDLAFAEPAEDGGAPLAKLPTSAPTDAEPLGALEQLLVITKNDPGLAILTASITRLPIESQFVASTLVFTLYEQRRMMSEVMGFTTQVMQSLATGRNAPPEVSAIYRDLYAREQQRAVALAEQNEALKHQASGVPGATPPSPYGEIAKIVAAKVAERVTDKVMAGVTPEMIQQFASMGG